MHDKSTDELMSVLQNLSIKDINDIYSEDFLGSVRDFPALMDNIIEKKGLIRKDIFQRADIAWREGYKILRGEVRTANRDKLLRLFFAMELTLKQVQRALALYEMPQLYPRKKRDAVLIIAFNRKQYSLDRVNEKLMILGLPPLEN